MAVKLDVLINYIFDNDKLKRNISNINNMMTKGTISPRSGGGASFDPLRAMLGQGKELVKFVDNWKQHSSDVLKNTIASINKLNVGGFFKEYIDPESNKSGRRINLNKDEVKKLAEKMTDRQLKEEMRMMQHEKYVEQVAWEENKKFDEKKKIQERRNQEAEARKIMGEEKWNKKMNILHSKALEENKKRDEALRKKQWMLMLGRWGKLGVWGLVAQQAIKYVSRAVGYAYATSMEGLDWERTIRGGAAGGSWFGQGLAAYQRAGIGKANYQNFKRGIQSYLGAVKLGTGNAAPLMWLGLNALDNPDEIERQMERALRRAPKDESLAMAGMLGLDYNMWDAIYSGRIDRQKSAYSEEAIQKWSEVADRLNDLLTTLKVFGFNKLADVAYNITHPTEAFSQMGFFDKMLMRLGMANPLMFGSTALLRFGSVDVVVRNEKGEVIAQGTSQPEIENTVMQYQGS